MSDEARHMSTISSNGYSHDQQVHDALAYLEHNHEDVYLKLLREFPEASPSRLIWEGSWFNTERMGVDVEWSSWLCDAIENTGLVTWEDGEPWSVHSVS